MVLWSRTVPVLTGIFRQPSGVPCSVIPFISSVYYKCDKREQLGKNDVYSRLGYTKRMPERRVIVGWLLLIAIVAFVVVAVSEISHFDWHTTADNVSSQPNDGLVPVAKVIDGDTIDVKTSRLKTDRVRLIGIDTPEVVDPRKPVQCFGPQASTEAHKLLDGQRVKLLPDTSQDDQDKYGRLLRYVFLADGTLINQKLIAEGFAHEYTYDKPYQAQGTFRQVETAAKAAGLGFWNAKTCNGVTK